MPIVNKVPELVAKKFGGADKINLSEVAREMDLTYSTVSGWVKNRIDRVDFPILAKWCKYLNCSVGDLLVYIPDDNIQ
jgi:putative transcriptional regulator